MTRCLSWTGGFVKEFLSDAEKISSYADPNRLVTTDWLAKNLDRVTVIESDEDVLLYESGHIPGSIKVDWHTDLNDTVLRDYLSPEKFRDMCVSKGISDNDIIVFYGDKSNWWAAYAAWVFCLYGNDNWKLLDGGRDKWISEGRPMTKEVANRPRGTYALPVRNDDEIRAYRDDVAKHIGKQMIDVRSTREYTGELTNMPEYPQEGALRGGHVPSAVSIPWSSAVGSDGTFLPREKLEEIYFGQTGHSADKDTIVYCRIGERSSHTWFVMKYLLGVKHIRNYDGSWTEWGNLVRAPIVTGPNP
ncbi:sulfurtransferase [Tropheryma whipplei]|uniref:sulfurtransferase n=1 Tax=Tropheryma whipplei TaxID=2039 RepID=UPI0009B85032|nr:sulfurtransferase [Tropheryma whipplei]